MTGDLVPTDVDSADVYKAGRLAGRLTRTDQGVLFGYTDQWIDDGGPPVASTLPVVSEPVLSVGGAVPAYFAGLLPEGRRLSALRRVVKTSADDELSLLLAVGSDPVGDVQVVPEGAEPTRAAPHLALDNWQDVRFADVMAEYDVRIDRVGLAGVQDKVSLAMLSLPVVAGSGSYILKLNPPEFRHLVENEAFFLARAGRSRIDAVRGELVVDRDGAKGLVVRRFDRVLVDGEVQALAVEDGCQALGLHPEAKYRRSTEEVLSALVALCAAPGPAALEFLRQVAYAYVTGNGDAHAKNFSVLQGRSGRWAPAPAYDLPSSQPYGDSTLALTVDGRLDGNITGRRFVALGAAIGLNARAARRAVVDTADAVDGWIDELDSLPFDSGVVRKLRRVILRRRGLLRDTG